MWTRIQTWLEPPPIVIKDPVEWRRHHDRLAQSVARTSLLLAAFCFFSVLMLTESDKVLIIKDATVPLPYGLGVLSYSSFMYAGPALLITLSFYLQINFSQLRRRPPPSGARHMPYFFNFPDNISRTLTSTLIFWTTPIALWFFAWKSLPRSEGNTLVVTAALVTAISASLYLRYAVTMPRRARAASLIFIIVVGSAVLPLTFLQIITINSCGEPIPELHATRRLSLNGEDLQGNNLSGVVLVNSSLVNANLNRAIASKANFRGSNLKNAEMQDAQMQKADFSFAALTNAEMQGAKMQMAYLYAADLSNAKLSGANLDFAFMNGVRAENANFKNATLRNAQFSSSVLRYADLSGANLDSASIDGVQAENADFRNTIMRNAQFFGSVLRNADLSGADLYHAHLKGAKELTCKQLRMSLNWEASYRDPSLACGSSIPKAEGETDDGGSGGGDSGGRGSDSGGSTSGGGKIFWIKYKTCKALTKRPFSLSSLNILSTS